eukprot:5240967-Amphidinium_carterae.2
MVLYEDFGRSMLDFLRSGKRPSDEDADKCAADLLRALSAMHKALKLVQTQVSKDSTQATPVGYVQVCCRV